MQIESNEDEYGFYEVGPLKFTAKIEAILAGERTGDLVTFNFNDVVYSAVPWTVEPTETIEQLYAKRAWELRNKYDYLILHYSGGWDSHNILETFIKNKIPLEEVYLRGNLRTVTKDIRNTYAANQFAEMYFNSYPIAEYVKDKYYPNLIITVKDLTDHTIDFFNSAENTLSFMSPTRRGATFSPSVLMTRANSDIINPEHRKLTESGKKVGHILGIDKPAISYSNGEYRIRFLDKVLGLFFQGRASTIDIPAWQEPFYWSPTTGPLIAKQCHLIKNHIKRNNLDPNMLNGTRSREYHDFIGNIIYDRQIPLTFNPIKTSVESLLYPWDDFFFTDPNAQHVQNWKNGLNELEKIVPAIWKNNGTMYGDIKGVFSKSYSIGQ